MLKILLPVDGSNTSNKAVAEFIKLLGWYKEVPEIHLLNIQLPLHGNIAMFLDKESIKQYHQAEGLRGLQAARDLLTQAGIACQFHIVVGDPAETIVRYAAEKQCSQIVIGPRGLGTVKSLLLGSVASKVMHLSTMPVLLIK